MNKCERSQNGFINNEYEKKTVIGSETFKQKYRYQSFKKYISNKYIKTHILSKKNK